MERVLWRLNNTLHDCPGFRLFAHPLTQALLTRNNTGATETNWANVRFELNTLADIYNLARVGSAVYR